MWYKTDPEGLKWEEVIALYKIVDQRERAFREDLFHFTNFYSAVCYAILAVTLSGFLSLYGKGSVILALLFGPALTLAMCVLGIRVTSRIYRRIIEEISTKAKLENVLGLDSPLRIAQYLGEKPIWEEDSSILSPRHAQRRLRQNGSAGFIDTAAKSGFYKDNRVYFGLIAISSILLTIAIIVAKVCRLGMCN